MNKYKLRCSYLKEIFNSVDDEVKEHALKDHEEKLGQSFANAICKEMREKKKAVDKVRLCENLLVQMDEYLGEGGINAICSTSIYHNSIKSMLEKLKEN